MFGCRFVPLLARALARPSLQTLPKMQFSLMNKYVFRN